MQACFQGLKSRRCANPIFTNCSEDDPALRIRLRWETERSGNRINASRQPAGLRRPDSMLDAFFTFSKARVSIWRTRSRETPNSSPSSSRVIGF
jgi:hypothetical protein